MIGPVGVRPDIAAGRPIDQAATCIAGAGASLAQPCELERSCVYLSSTQSKGRFRTECIDEEPFQRSSLVDSEAAEVLARSCAGPSRKWQGFSAHRLSITHLPEVVHDLEMLRVPEADFHARLNAAHYSHLPRAGRSSKRQWWSKGEGRP